MYVHAFGRFQTCSLEFQDCLQCNNKVSGTKFSLKIAHNLETCFQTQLFESHKQENMEIASFKWQESFSIFLD